MDKSSLHIIPFFNHTCKWYFKKNHVFLFACLLCNKRTCINTDSL